MVRRVFISLLHLLRDGAPNASPGTPVSITFQNRFLQERHEITERLRETMVCIQKTATGSATNQRSFVSLFCAKER